MKILFVCTGNTCRSPMAEALLKNSIPEANVQSAGIFAAKNQRPNDHTMEALKREGIKLNTTSQPVTEKLLHWADLVLTMTTQHKQSLILEYPDFQEKYYTLKEYVSHADEKIWNELKQRYAAFEEKRSRFIQNNQNKMDQHKLQNELTTYLQDDWQEIQKLESSLINYDISDPFGGELSVYQQTLKEIKEHIKALTRKIEGNK